MRDTRWTEADARRYLRDSGRTLAPGSMSLENIDTTEQTQKRIRMAVETRIHQDDSRDIFSEEWGVFVTRQHQTCRVLHPVVTPEMLPLEVTLNIQLRAKGNGGYRQRYAESKHIKAQRQGVYNALCGYGSPHLLTGPLTITITRIAPRLLGRTNPVLAAAKHVVDGIADWLTSKPGKGHYYDDDPRLTWNPQQEKGAKGVYAVHIRIEETL